MDRARSILPRLVNTAVFLTSCLIALGGAELGLRLWGPEVLALGNQQVFYRYDPVLGWDNMANAHGRFSRAEFSYLVTINSSGLWDAEIKEKSVDEFRVAVLGDSFTWGVGAAYGERFTEYLEANNPRINALNFGVAGFSPIQYLLQLDKVLSLKPDYVIVAFCLGNDLSDNVRYSPYDHPKPYVTLSADGKNFEIKGYPLRDTKKTGSYLIGAASSLRIVGIVKYLWDRANKPREEGSGEGIDDAIFYVPLDKLSAAERQKVLEAFKVNELIFAAMKRKIDAALGPHRFAVLLVPTKFETGQNHLPPGSDRNAVGDKVSADLSRLGIPVVDGRVVINESDFWKIDGHWRPSGHKKIALLLAKSLPQ